MFETGSDCRVSVQRPSAVCGKRSGDGERDSGLARKVFGIAPEPAFTISPENRSDSTRNNVRLHPGMAFGLRRIPQDRSSPAQDQATALACRLPAAAHGTGGGVVVLQGAM